MYVLCSEANEYYIFFLLFILDEFFFVGCACFFYFHLKRLCRVLLHLSKIRQLPKSNRAHNRFTRHFWKMKGLFTSRLLAFNVLIIWTKKKCNVFIIYFTSIVWAYSNRCLVNASDATDEKSVRKSTLLVCNKIDA